MNEWFLFNEIFISCIEVPIPIPKKKKERKKESCFFVCTMSTCMVRLLLTKSRSIIHGRTLHVCSVIRSGSIDKIDVPLPKLKMDDYFVDRRVQILLLKITGFDLEKIYRPVKKKLAVPVYRFVTDKQLRNMHDQIKRKAYTKLQMPPVMEIKKSEVEILSYDPELQGYEECTQVFIDISLNVPERDRIITVREPDGTLRKANSEERFRMNQIFFPREGRNFFVPKLFESPHLDRLLDEGSYIFVLDSACIQFEPDDYEYHRVTSATYEHISAQKKFDVLRSTRHFGPMSFYFAWNKNIERLLLDMIERELITDAANLIRLLYILNPELLRNIEDDDDAEVGHSLDIVKDFIQENSSVHKPHLELAIQTYIEAQEKSEEKKSAEANISS